MQICATVMKREMLPLLQCNYATIICGILYMHFHKIAKKLVLFELVNTDISCKLFMASKIIFLLHERSSSCLTVTVKFFDAALKLSLKVLGQIS